MSSVIPIPSLIAFNNAAASAADPAIFVTPPCLAIVCEAYDIDGLCGAWDAYEFWRESACTCGPPRAKEFPCIVAGEPMTGVEGEEEEGEEEDGGEAMAARYMFMEVDAS